MSGKIRRLAESNGASLTEGLERWRMDRTGIKTYKASPVGKEEIPSLAIMFDQEVPEFKCLGDAGMAYHTAAKEIVTAMGRNIPGGLFDAILVEMMRAKVTLFRVPHFTEEG